MVHKVIDIFAGPGGLSEGFASYTDSRGKQQFEIGVSAEMEESAHATLSLRALGRRVNPSRKDHRKAFGELLAAASSSLPTRLADLASASPFAREWTAVSREVLKLTLGVASDNSRLKDAILEIAKPRASGLVLIGGPPCQAYSLVGRARNRGIKGYRPEADKRHFLYEQYLSILETHRPDVFIMENVKGILSSEVSGNPMFERILDDLQRPGKRKGLAYRLVPLCVSEGSIGGDLFRAAPRQFIVRAERLGIPQARHRVIIMGVREGTSANAAIGSFSGVPELPAVCLRDVLSDLPPLRSGLSRGDDSPARWKETLESVRLSLIRATRKPHPEVAAHIEKLRFSASLERSSNEYARVFPGSAALRQHYRGSSGVRLRNHETRGHMDADLARYLFCSAWGVTKGISPTIRDFPDVLKPNHRSWSAGHFADRFRVQLPHLPGNTVTSHLAKDGHQFIHWDSEQCRSLTVREAARIQTFPDDYAFLGNRTQQYTQVGNAVPPLLARSIAGIVHQLLG